MVPSLISDQILAILYLQVTLMLPCNQVWSQLAFRFRRRNEKKIFKMAAMLPSWISNQNDFSYFDLLVTPMIPIKFQDNQPFVSGEEAKNRFSGWRHGGNL